MRDHHHRLVRDHRVDATLNRQLAFTGEDRKRRVMDHDRRVLRELPDRDPLPLASLKPPAGIAGRSLPAPSEWAVSR
ncbi:hypothetical protein LZ189_20520, partial [Rhodovulum sulfidophilum]|nr:hypothetical protein [Rhodovulum sulfidophilum]